jgi:phage-related protein
MLRNTGEDYEFYPTTDEIMAAMRKDLWGYLRAHDTDRQAEKRSGIAIDVSREWDEKKKSHTSVDRLEIASFLDIGAGDGRVLSCLDEDQGTFRCNKYGIEKARAQADDLIRRGVFVIGIDFWDVTLIDRHFALIYSNPPFSQFEQWVCKILYEGNFSVLYLVMPKRWTGSRLIAKELEGKYEHAIVGEFDFSEADREARGKVHLVRINAGWHEKTEKGTDRHGKKWKMTLNYQEPTEDAFARFVREHIADFQEKPEREWEEESETALALKLTPVDQLISDYEAEKQSLGDAFKAIGKLDAEIIRLLGQDKKSMLEIIRQSFGSLKSKYWRAAFDRLEPVKSRMTLKTRESIFRNIEEFKTLDFNADNIYSIAIWIIENTNFGILGQIGQVFDALTHKDFFEEYKSNRHWKKGDWRNAEREWRLSEMPERWKLGLDYRIVVRTYAYDRYSCRARYTVVDDFMVICHNLGFPISPSCKPDYKMHQSEQKFYTLDGELAFTMRFYTGNGNAHLKINKKLLMKFNIEVAKIRRWMSEPDDVVEEYGVPKDEAVRLWNGGLALIGSSDIQMLEYKEEENV